jgi:hypothetical protein
MGPGRDPFILQCGSRPCEFSHGEDWKRQASRDCRSAPFPNWSPFTPLRSSFLFITSSSGFLVLSRIPVVGHFEKLGLSICHGERSASDPAQRGSVGESNHPDNLSLAMPQQGVLPRHLLLCYRQKSFPEENSLKLHSRGRNSPGCFDLRLSRLRRDSRGAQHDKVREIYVFGSQIDPVTIFLHDYLLDEGNHFC